MHERSFEEVGEEALHKTVPPGAAGPPDFERVAAIAAKYGTEIPPPKA